MISNPFETISERLSKVEETNNLILDILNKQQKVEPKEETEQLITFDELAELLHISKTTAYSNYSKGAIPAGYKKGKRVLFDKQIIISWIKSGRKLSNAELEQQSEAY